jgi:hypothetical protein
MKKRKIEERRRHFCGNDRTGELKQILAKAANLKTSGDYFRLHKPSFCCFHLKQIALLVFHFVCNIRLG